MKTATTEVGTTEVFHIASLEEYSTEALWETYWTFKPIVAFVSRYASLEELQHWQVAQEQYRDITIELASRIVEPT